MACWLIEAKNRKLDQLTIKDMPVDEAASEVHRMFHELGEYPRKNIRTEDFTDQILVYVKQGQKWRRVASVTFLEGPALGDTIYWNVEELRAESGPTGKFIINEGIVLQIGWNWFLVAPEVGGPKKILKSWLTKPPEAPADIELDRDSLNPNE